MPLPGGGRLLIEPTAACVAIDVDGGGRAPLDVDLAAAAEIARQVRLRNLGGTIIVDFVDLPTRPERQRLEEALRKAFRDDPAPLEIHPMSSLGIVQISRARRGAAAGEPVSGAMRLLRRQRPASRRRAPRPSGCSRPCRQRARSVTGIRVTRQLRCVPDRLGPAPGGAPSRASATSPSSSRTTRARVPAASRSTSARMAADAPARAAPAAARLPDLRAADRAGFRPFCSARCRDQDLLNWLGGRYAVPAVDETDEDEERQDDQGG